MKSAISLFRKTPLPSTARNMSSNGNGSKKIVEENFEAIREYLCQFAGGTVTLQKDDTTGVATISLDHPEKRNAMSGKKLLNGIV